MSLLTFYLFSSCGCYLITSSTRGLNFSGTFSSCCKTASLWHPAGDNNALWNFMCIYVRAQLHAQGHLEELRSAESDLMGAVSDYWL